MKFVIRDDDLNYFSARADIERWYEGIFAEKIPVGFAVIPFVKPISDVYTNDAPQEDKEYPISANTELVEYVKSNPLIEVLQHGCTHETRDGIFEYRRRSGLFEDTRRGKEELTKTFGVVDIFVPPHDWIGSHGVLAVEAVHMNIIRGRGAGLRNWIARWRYLGIFVRMLWFKASHLSHAMTPAYPFVLDYALHKEVCSYRLEDVDVFEGLTYAHRANGIFVVVVHVHTLNDEKSVRLLSLIQKARDYGAEFVGPSVLFS